MAETTWRALMAAVLAIVTIDVASAGGVNRGRGDSVASANAGALTLKELPPPVRSANLQQVNMPAQAFAIRQVANTFKGTHDLAGAAEAIVAAAGSQFVHSYGSNTDPARTPFSRIASFDQLYGQRLMVCYEFVHYVAYLASNQPVSPGDGTRPPAPRIGNADVTLYDTSNYTVWDGKGEIPRGKVIVFVAWAWNNAAGYYHVGISLGSGKIAHDSSTGNVQTSDISDVNSIGYSEVRIGDYNWRLAGEAGTPVSPPVTQHSALPTAPTTPQGPLVELQRALDNAQQGLRFAGPSTCCGDPLGAFYSAPAARPTSQFEFFVTGAPIDLEIPDSTTSPPPDDRPPGFTAFFGGSREHEPAGGPGFSANQPATDMPPPAPAISLVATGASTGDTFRLQVAGGPGVRGRLVASDGLILEPLSIRMPEPSGVAADTMVRNLPGFAVDFSKPPPPAGTMYRVADARQQDRLKPLRQLVRAADDLAAARGLHPDSDPAEYLDFVKQYAIWTTLERWDLRTFAEQFTARTKRVLETLKRPWTRDVEGQVRAMVPGRWADVQAVVHEAGARMNNQRR